MHDDKLAEEIDRLYESVLHTGDLEPFYECLKLACANDIVSQTAIELIKTRFVDDADVSDGQGASEQSYFALGRDGNGSQRW